MKKKILSLVLVAAMLASMLVFAPVSGAAETGVSVAATDAAGFAGDTVTVDIVITIPVYHLNAAQFLIRYDATRLEYVSSTTTDVWGANASYGNANGDVMDSFAPYITNNAANATNDSRYTAVIGFFWGEEGEAAFDASAGLAAFEVTFQIKEDAPAGDAFVEPCYLDNQSLLEGVEVVDGAHTANRPVYDQPGQVDWIGGTISVLDDSAVPVVDPGAFEYVDNEDGTCMLTKYYGDASVLNIPSEIDGLTVISIAPFFFVEADPDTGKITKDSIILENNKVNTIIIPETVVELGDWAFVNANALQNVFVLGTLDYCGYGAIGFVGNTWKSTTSGSTANRGKSNEDAWPVTDDVNVTIRVSSADALGADFAANNEADGLTYPIVEFGESKAVYTVTVDGAEKTYLAVGGAKAPVADGIIGWTDAEGNVYAPGADLGGATGLTAMIVDAPVTDAGVTAKFTATDLALRFTATFSVDTYNAVAALGDSVVMGMLITPERYVAKAGNAFTMEALDAYVAGSGYVGYVKIENTNAYKAFDAEGVETLDVAEAATLVVAGSLSDIRESTVSKNIKFAAIGYLQALDAEGNVVATVYGDYDSNTADTIGNFVTAIETPDDANDTQIGWIENWKSKFN